PGNPRRRTLVQGGSNSESSNAKGAKESAKNAEKAGKAKNGQTAKRRMILSRMPFFAISAVFLCVLSVDDVASDSAPASAAPFSDRFPGQLPSQGIGFSTPLMSRVGRNCGGRRFRLSCS